MNVLNERRAINHLNLNFKSTYQKCILPCIIDKRRWMDGWMDGSLVRWNGTFLENSEKPKGMPEQRRQNPWCISSFKEINWHKLMWFSRGHLTINITYELRVWVACVNGHQHKITLQWKRWMKKNWILKRKNQGEKKPANELVARNGATVQTTTLTHSVHIDTNGSSYGE